MNCSLYASAEGARLLLKRAWLSRSMIGEPPALCTFDCRRRTFPVANLARVPLEIPFAKYFGKWASLIEWCVPKTARFMRLKRHSAVLTE